jgi:hypothetical protein
MEAVERLRRRMSWTTEQDELTEMRTTAAFATGPTMRLIAIVFGAPLAATRSGRADTAARRKEQGKVQKAAAEERRRRAALERRTSDLERRAAEREDRTSAATTTNSPPTPHHRSGRRQHSPGSHSPCDQRSRQTRHLSRHTGRNRPPWAIAAARDRPRYQLPPYLSVIAIMSPARSGLSRACHAASTAGARRCWCFSTPGAGAWRRR